MARFHSIKLALIQCFLGARHHSAWYSCNGWPQTASSKSGHVWQTAQQSHCMHGAGRIIVLNRLLPPNKEIESPHVSTSLTKAPFLSWDCGTQDSPSELDMGSENMCHIWAELQGHQRPWPPDRARDEGPEQHRPGFCLQLTHSSHAYHVSRREGLFMVRKWDLWTTVTLANSAALHMFVHVHTHTLQYEVMQNSEKVSEKSQQLTWSLKVLPNIHSAPLNSTLPSVIWACTHPTLVILLLSLLPPSCPQDPPPTGAQAPLWCLWITLATAAGTHQEFLKQWHHTGLHQENRESCSAQPAGQTRALS